MVGGISGSWRARFLHFAGDEVARYVTQYDTGRVRDQNANGHRQSSRVSSCSWTVDWPYDVRTYGTPQGQQVAGIVITVRLAVLDGPLGTRILFKQ